LTIDLILVNGKVFTPEGFKEGGVAVEGMTILKVGKEPSLPKASERINVRGALILPGLIDIHVHLRDLGQKKKETFETGTRAALAGGVTTVLDMPNNVPPTNSVAQLRKKELELKGKAAVNVGFYALVPETLEEIFPLAQAGVFGYKIYPASVLYPHKNDEKLKDYLDKIAQTKLPLIIHPDAGNAHEREQELFASERSPIDAFTKAHNQTLEVEALKAFLLLNEETKARLHCAHVTAKETVQLLQDYSDTENLSSEVCPHHLFLTVNDLKKLRSQAKCLPPLRSSEDQRALWQALKDDIIPIIATDHAPHTYHEKFCEFEQAACGLTGLETLLPLMFTAALKGLLPFESLISKLTSNPAHFLDLPKRGVLRQGCFADIIVVAKEKTTINAEEFESKAKWSPFDGYPSLVTLKKVLVNGVLVKDDEHIVLKARSGKILKSKLKIAEELLTHVDD